MIRSRYRLSEPKKDDLDLTDLWILSRLNTTIKNVDILANISNHNSLRPRLTIGFAAETNDLINNSLKKLDEKNCDWIVANDVSDKSIGFNSDENQVSIFYKNKTSETLEKMKKSLIAKEIVNRVIDKLN